MNDQLSPGDVGLKYGNTLPALNHSASVKIMPKFDENGKVTSAQLKITYNMDPDFLFSSMKPNDPPVAGGYELDMSEIGFPGKRELFNATVSTDSFSISLDNSAPYLNLKLPLKNAIKRNVEAEHAE
jgi:hypothetical protein